MAQKSANLVGQIRNHDQTLTEIKNNITAIGQHGSVLLNLLKEEPSEDDELVTELVASINLLSNMSVSFIEGYQYLSFITFEFLKI